MKTKQLLLLSVLIITTMLSSMVFSSTATLAEGDSVVDQINITVPVSCTMSGTGMTSHNADITNGTFDSAIGETTIKAFCNDNNGFAIYAIGYTDNEDGKNVLTNSTLGSTYDIVTGTATGPVSNVDTSNWAMKLSTITSPVPTYPVIIAGSITDTDKETGDLDYSSFQEVPDDYTKVAYRKASTDINPSGQNTAEGSTLKTTYQAYISKTQPAGTYSGQVKYTLVHPHDTTAPKKPISIETAMKNANKQKLNGYYKMQDVDNTICSAVNVLEADSLAELIDTRDNQVYKVAKLKDGKCWMVENLNIAGGTALSSTDTDFDTSYTLPTTNGWTVTDGKLVLPDSSTAGFSIGGYAYVYNSGNRERENCSATDQQNPCYSYYSWDAATLGSGRTIDPDTDANYSICPKNWKLPTSRYSSVFDADIAANSDFYNLATSYGMPTGAWKQDTYDFYEQAGSGTIPDFLIAGYYSNDYGSQYYSGGSGIYWSSTRPSANYALTLRINGYYEVDTAHKTFDRVGFSVRCLFGG